MNKEKFKNIISKLDSLELNDDLIHAKCWREEVAVLTEDVKGTIDYLNSECTEDEYSWISEIIEELVEITKSKELLDSYKGLMQKYPKASREYNIASFVESAEACLQRFSLLEEKAKKKPVSIVDTLFSIWLNPQTAEKVMAGKIERDHLVSIVMAILDWLQLERKREIWISEGRKTRLKDMKLNYECPWCRSLRDLVDSDGFFSKTFFINGRCLNFNDSIPEEMRVEARRQAFEEYNPPVFDK